VFAPFDITISEGGTGVQVDDRGRAMLTPGRHRLRFQNVELGYDETRTVNVKPADTTTINLTPQATIAVTSNEPAEVLVDGTLVGETPYNGKVSLGTHAVTVRTAGAERQLTVQATSKPLELQVDFSKP
jgi:archaellum component FlaF (FlaF/FlaG flagellin family)